MKDVKIIQWILKVFLTWRLALLGVVWLGIRLFPFRSDFLGGGVKAYLKNPLLWAWANFDGYHYLLIAEKGYGLWQQAFFPFYPYLFGFLAAFLKNYFLSGLLVSHLSFLVALFLFYKLVRLDFNQKIAKRTLVYLVLFPTSFYFVSLYSESLFLALILGSFYAARKKRWGVAGILGGFASATRLAGIFLFPALFVEWWWQNRKTKVKNFKNILPLFLITLGLLVYMGYLKKTVGDPLYFVHVQPFFGAERTGGKLILLYQVFWRYFKMLLTVEKWTPTYFVVVLEALTGVGFLFLTIFTYLRRWFSYLTFMALAYLAPTLTGTLSSMPRYVLVLFPGFILMSVWAEKYEWAEKLYPLIAIPLLLISLILFSRGFFVA